MKIVIIAIVVIAIFLLLYGIIPAEIQHSKEKEKQKKRNADKDKLRENELLKATAKQVKEYIRHTKNAAEKATLNEGTRDVFAVWIDWKEIAMQGGLVEKEEPHFDSMAEEYCYGEYSAWLEDLETISTVHYEQEGYSNMDIYSLRLFVEVLGEELDKTNCHWHRSADQNGNILLFWDFTSTHPIQPKKQLKSFL